MPGPKPKTVDEYINAAQDEAQEKLMEIRSILKQVAPKAIKAVKWDSPVFEFRKLYIGAIRLLNCRRGQVLIVIAFMLTLFSYRSASAQQKTQMVRLAKLVIDSTQLESYKALLKEEIETSVRVEPGVLTLYAVAEKNNPTHITILEIYADTAAYKSHLQTPHFIKYKTGTQHMVKSLELVETVPLVPGMKIK
ncbi:antibiotic biosynthesis monooxygenase [Terrimonas pollutisoli]|uniref:antibiotic biosynthesis monooxygenase n=1 Tax=Terrimonas pollutisoli TaxID=3034147 RepID=UPI0023EDCC14|nr:antibiotic biosynthesis monooxygenase [Terrimonas sp. H1YJ31]